MKKLIILSILAVLAMTAFGQTPEGFLMFPKTKAQPIGKVLEILNNPEFEFFYYDEVKRKMTPLSCPDCEVDYKRLNVAYRKKPVLTEKKVDAIVMLDTFFILPTIWNEIPETVVLKLQQPPKKEEEEPLGLHIFGEQVVVRDFDSDEHQVNNETWFTTRVGVESNQWGNPWDFAVWFGFYPKRDFKKSFALPNVSANPLPDEGWCDCKVSKSTAEFSLGLKFSRNIHLGNFLGGEWGLKPEVSGDLVISGNPVPSAEWHLPGAVEISLPIHWQVHLKGPGGKKTGATASLAIGPGWDFAHKVFAVGFSGKLSLGTKLFAPKPKKEAQPVYKNPRFLD